MNGCVKPDRFGLYAGLGLASWALYVALVSMFYPTGGDEPGYFYTVLRMAEGRIPVLDFFALQPPGFFIPYVLVAKFISPSLEAARLVSVSSVVAVSVMVALLVGRAYGRAFGVFAFAMMGFSHFWFYWNVQVIHYSISNLSLVSAFFILQTGRPRRRTWFLAGLAAGWLANSRLILAPVALVLFYLALRRARADTSRWGDAIRQVAPAFISAGILVSLPTLALLVADPQAWTFDFLTARAGVENDVRWHATSAWETAWNFIRMRLIGTYALFFWIDDTLKATVNNCILFVPPLLALVHWFRLAVPARLAWRHAVRADDLIVGSGWIIVGVFGIHYLTLLSAPYYMQGALPFMVIGGLGLLAQVLEARGGLGQKWTLRVLGVSLVPMVAYYLFWTGAHLIRRFEPSSGRPAVAALVGCWVEQNTRPDEIVMSYGTLPVSLGGRHLPDGFEYNNVVAWVFWRQEIDEATARRFHILRREDFVHLLETDKLRVLIDDRHLESEMRFVPQARPLVADKYRPLWTTGGAFPYAVLVLKSAWRDDLPRMAPLDRSAVLLKASAPGGLAGKAALAARDALRSLSHLPNDVADSLARIRHAPFERRCRAYLEAASTGPKAR